MICKHDELIQTNIFESGVPQERVDQLIKFGPPQKLVKDGDSYTYITVTPEGPQETKFKSGVEFDDVIGTQKTPVSIKNSKLS